VSDDLYNLYGSHGREGWVLDHRAVRSGPSGRRDTWVVFYTERGDESQLRTFDSEIAACDYLFSRLVPDTELEQE
ncbi:MAG TPA: hypothetical protein VEH29_04845, partial [Acidimicrobiales bacterium]|nr:hypothetical protein [Acidimicrobiales bacterium]